MSDPTIGSELAKRRLALGLEKGQAADRIGMSRTTYSSYERDTQRPSVDVFPALANFLAVDMEEFLALYGATCIAVVRESLVRTLVVDSASESGHAPQPNVQQPIIERAYGASVEADRDIARSPIASEVPNVADASKADKKSPFFMPVSPANEVLEDSESPDVEESPSVPEIPSPSKVFGDVAITSISPIQESRASALPTAPEFFQEDSESSDLFKMPEFLKASETSVDSVIRESPLIDFREKSSKSKKKKKKGKNGKK